MKPAYSIGIMAMIGAVAGYAVFRQTGWLGSGLGAAVGVVVGVLIYRVLRDKTKGDR